MKSAFISIIGRPSSGKSTFINKVCGNKVSIVSTVPQTTRNKIRGIYTCPEAGQLIFIDTPGYNISEKKFNNYLQQLVYYSVQESDLLLYMIDATRLPGEEEEAVSDLLRKAKQEVIIALNKIDQTDNHTQVYLQSLPLKFPAARNFQISGLTGQGMEELISYLLEKSPEGELYYPAEYYTDQQPDFRIAEIIREKVIHSTREEVPHSIYVEVLDLEIREETNTLWARCVIYVERDSQKGIIIGKEGRVIKMIKNQALEELNQLFPYEIDLDLRVKVKYKWRRQDQLISQLLK